MLTLPAARSAAARSEDAARSAIDSLPLLSTDTLMQLCGSVLREMKRREFARFDAAKLADIQAIVDNWE